MKAVIWGSCGSLPSPLSSAAIERKMIEAIWGARTQSFESMHDVEKYISTLPHSSRGTYKANTSCVQIVTKEDEYIFCDAGTGLRDYSLSLGKNTEPATYHIFISHLHWDHIQGLPFFTPAYRPENRIVFHGFHKQIEAALKGQMSEPYFPVPFEAMKAQIEFDIREEGASFQIGDVQVSTIKQQHPGESWGYRFEEDGQSIVYSSDSEHGPDARNPDYPFVDFFKTADVLIFDGQYTFEEATNEKRHWGHSDHITAIELAARAKVKKLIVFHHEPGYADAEIEAIHQDALSYRENYNQKLQTPTIYPLQIDLAYDGLEIDTQTTNHVTN